MADSYYRAGYTGSEYSKIYMELHVYTVSTDLANLKTTERADLYMVVNDASSQWWNEEGTSKAGITVNSHSTGDKTANFNAKNTGAKTLISSWDTEITHNSDGKASINVSAYHNSATGLGNATLPNQTYTCDTLNVTPSFTTNPSVTGKTETSVTVNRGATNISSNFYWSTNNSTWTKFTAATATITGLSANTAYTIYVQARNANNESYKTTKTLSVTTYANPSQSLASKTENRITINWSLDTAADYVWYSTNNGSSWVAVGSANATSGSYTITGLTANTAYNIRTRLRRKATQTTSYSSNLAVTTYKVPTQSLNSKTETSIKMNWSVDSTADYIWYSKDNGSSWVAVGNVSATSGNYTISGLTAGTTYNIKTRVRRKATQTTYDTTSLSVKTYALPTQSVYDATETTITMNWSIDSAADKLYYSTDGGSNWSSAVTVSGTSGTYTITGLTANTGYNVLLRLHRVATDSNVQPSSSTSIKTLQYPYITSIEKEMLTIGEKQKITIYNPLNRKVNVYMYSTTNSSIVFSASGTGDVFEFQPTESNLYASIPNSQTGKANYYVSYSNQVVATKSGTYKIKGTEKPTFSDFTYVDTDTNVTNLTGTTGNNPIVVNGYSDITVTISSSNKATGNNSATISKYRVTIGNTSKEETYSSSDVTVPFTNVTSPNISVTAIDSRGLETTVSKVATFKDYRNITFTNATVERENGVGTKIYFNLEAKYWYGDFGTGVNVFSTAWYRWRKVGGTYSSYITFPMNLFNASQGNLKSIDDAFLPISRTDTTPRVFSLGTEYEIEILVADKLGNTAWQSITLTLDSGIPCTDKYKDDDGNYHTGINQLAEDDVAVAIKGGLKVDSERITDGIIVSVSEPSTKEKVWIKKSRNIFNLNSTPVHLWNLTVSNLSTGVRAKSTTAGQYCYGIYKLGGSELLGQTITMSTTMTPSANNNGAIAIFYGSSSNVVKKTADLLIATGSKTITLASSFPTDCDGVYFGVYSNRNGTGAIGAYVDYTNLMVELSPTPHPYEPYENDKTYIRNDNGTYDEYMPIENAITYNKFKNMIEPATSTLSLNGVTKSYSVLGGKYTFSGTATGNSALPLTAYMKFESGKTYTISTNYNMPTGVFIYANNYGNLGLTYANMQLATGTQKKTFTPTQTGIVSFSIYFAQGTNASNMSALALQIEEGEINTDFAMPMMLKSPSLYITDEVCIGTWTDGKPLYRKVVNIGSLPNVASKSVNHNIQNLGTVVKLYGMMSNGYPLPFISGSSISGNIVLFATTTHIVIQTGADRSQYTGNAIMEYTKTTD